jgi:hypothetical protein
MARASPVEALAGATPRVPARSGRWAWFVTPEPEPLASCGTALSVAASQRLEPEGIAFIGSTYPDVRGGFVLLDPQGESIQVDWSSALATAAGSM